MSLMALGQNFLSLTVLGTALVMEYVYAIHVSVKETGEVKIVE